MTVLAPVATRTVVVRWMGWCLHRHGSGDGSHATMTAMMVLALEAAGMVYNEKKNVSKKKEKRKNKDTPGDGGGALAVMVLVSQWQR
jgi:hypothetical protein